jgi:DNA-binding CsgD family transcriptional regulator
MKAVDSLVLKSSAYKKIHKMFSSLERCCGEDDGARKILRGLNEALDVDKSVLFLPGDDTRQMRLFARNIEDATVNTYLQDLSRQYNPFRMAPMARFRGHTATFEKLVYFEDYRYGDLHDFMCEQGISTDLHLLLGTKNRPEAVIGLFKLKREHRFSIEDTGMLRLLGPYLNAVVKNVKRFTGLQAERDMFKGITEKITSGVIILNDSMDTICHVNQRAREIVEKTDGYNVDDYPLLTQKCRFGLTTKIREVCACVKKYMEVNRHEIAPPPIHRIVDLENTGEYALSCQVLINNLIPMSGPFYLVEIREVRCNTRQHNQVLKQTYGLTDREVETANNLCNGFSNQQIATRLFISEITVKKHIQHIFDKVGVNSRSALISKMISRHGLFDDKRLLT